MSAAALALAMGGCGGSNAPEAEFDAGADASADADADTPLDRRDADASGQSGAPCEWAGQCRGDLICDPNAGACVDPGPCTEHDDCGRGAHCSEAGFCAPSDDHSPCARDADCAFEDRCVEGYCGCRGEAREAELRDVNMLVVLDRSGSMWEDAEGGEADTWEDTKWYAAISAVDTLLASVAESVDFGLVVFPHSEVSECRGCDQPKACTKGDVLVDVASGSEEVIRETLEGMIPECCTPTGATLEAYLGYEPLADPDADNYILLVADGRETCGGDAVSAAASLRGQDPSVRTFAVGFGGGVDPEELGAIAEAGGTAREGEPAYYQADNRAELERAFENIAVEAISCVHPVQGSELNPESLRVYADGDPLPRDPKRAEGWTYEADRNELSFHGSVCEDLQAGRVEDLSYVQGCDLVVD